MEPFDSYFALQRTIIIIKKLQPQRENGDVDLCIYIRGNHTIVDHYGGGGEVFASLNRFLCGTHRVPYLM
jgi:hypothetical protein